jgi:hypothetical protein
MEPCLGTGLHHAFNNPHAVGITSRELCLQVREQARQAASSDVTADERPALKVSIPGPTRTFNSWHSNTVMRRVGDPTNAAEHEGSRNGVVAGSEGDVQLRG